MRAHGLRPVRLIYRRLSGLSCYPATFRARLGGNLVISAILHNRLVNIGVGQLVNAPHGLQQRDTPGNLLRDRLERRNRTPRGYPSRHSDESVNPVPWTAGES